MLLLRKQGFKYRPIDKIRGILYIYFIVDAVSCKTRDI